MSDLFVESWGAGTPVVLVHGSLATGAEEWQAQRPLADEGFRLLVIDRRGYGQSPVLQGEDFLRDADDIAELMGMVPTSSVIRTAASGYCLLPRAVPMRLSRWRCSSQVRSRWASAIQPRGHSWTKFAASGIRTSPMRTGSSAS